MQEFRICYVRTVISRPFSDWHLSASPEKKKQNKAHKKEN
jgi:hypothetical protein